MKQECYCERGDFHELKDDWNTLLEKSSSNDVFLTWQWQSTWWTHFKQHRELMLLVVRDKSEGLLGLAPFFVESLPDGKRAIGFGGGTDVTDYLDIIAESEAEEVVCTGLVDFLVAKQDQWDRIDLHCLRETSTTLNVLKRFFVDKGYSVSISEEEVCPKILLPSSWEDYLNILDKKDRHELRRKIRRIERAFQSVRDHMVENPASFKYGMEQFLSLHRKSNAEKEGFMGTGMEAFFQAVGHSLFQNSWAKLSFLEVDGDYLASSLCFEYENKTYLYNSGYDPQYSSLSPGIVHVAHLIQKAIESGQKEFDFLRGSESYKYRFGAIDSSVYRMIVDRDNVT